MILRSPPQRFDSKLSVLDDSGLYGPTDGLWALDYEFCIPIPDWPDAVARIDQAFFE